MQFTGTKNFKPADVDCQCGCGMLPDDEFMRKVQVLRDVVGFPMKVTSGARCPAHNDKVSSTGLTGPHTTGRAIDFEVSYAQAFYVVSAAMKLGFSGIGVQQKGQGRFIHVDDLPNKPGQPRPTVWSY